MKMSKRFFFLTYIFILKFTFFISEAPVCTYTIKNYVKYEKNDSFMRTTFSSKIYLDSSQKKTDGDGDLF